MEQNWRLLNLVDETELASVKLGQWTELVYVKLGLRNRTVICQVETIEQSWRLLNWVNGTELISVKLCQWNRASVC